MKIFFEHHINADIFEARVHERLVERRREHGEQRLLRRWNQKFFRQRVAATTDTGAPPGGAGSFFFGQILQPPTRDLMGVPLRRRQMGVTVGKSTVVSQVQERRSKWVDRTQARIRGENLWSK